MSRGFSLVELLVGLAIAALLVAGLFQMNVSLQRQARRQERAAELQQNLRVATQILERAVRSAGRGLTATHEGFVFDDANPDSMRVRTADGSVVYRVDTSGATPKLTMSAGDDRKPIAIADGIEDVQLAVVLDDGSRCERACDFARAVAVRLAVTGHAGDVRRTLTSLVELRNYTR